MKLHRYPFNGEKSFEARLRHGRFDPFLVRAFDFTLPGAVSETNVAGFCREMVESFDGFRIAMQFDSAGALCASSYSGPPAPFAFHEVTSLADVEERATFLARERPGINLLNGPLVAFHYYRALSENRSKLRILCSHFATDQITLRLLAAAGHDYFSRGKPLSAPGCDYLSWMDAHAAYAGSAEAQKEIAFWENLPREPFTRAWQRLAAPAHTAKKITLHASAEMLSTLTARCREHWKCRVVDVIAAALLRALSGEFGFDSIPVNWTSHGRFPLQNLNFSQTRGWLGSRHPLLVPVPAEKPMLPLAFRNALVKTPNWGSTFAWIARFGGSGLPLESQLRSPFTIIVQENPASPVSSDPTIRASVPSLKVEPNPGWEAQCRSLLPEDIHPFYFVINLGRELRVVLDSAGDPTPGAAERMMESVRAELLWYSNETD